MNTCSECAFFQRRTLDWLETLDKDNQEFRKRLEALEENPYKGAGLWKGKPIDKLSRTELVCMLAENAEMTHDRFRALEQHIKDLKS